MTNTSRSKQIAKNTLMLYIRMLLIMGVTLYTSRVVLRVLGIEDFGIYNVVGGIVVMFGFLNSAMSSGTQRFLSYELGKRNYIELQKTFQIALNIHIGIAFIIFLLAETVGLWFLLTKMTIPIDRIHAAIWVYQFSIFSFLVTVIQVPYNATIIAHECMNVYAYVSVLEVILKLCVVFALEWANYDKLKLYAFLLFVVSFCIALIYRIYCRIQFTECRFALVWDRERYSTLLSYAGWNLFGNVASVGFNQGVNVLLNIFFGPIVNAARGIAYQVNAAILSFVSNFQLALNPGIVKLYASGEVQYMFSLVSQGSKYSFMLLSMLAIPILLETKYVLNLWLGMVPPYVVSFCQLIIINALIDSFSGSLMIAAQATGKIKKYQSIVGSILLLNVPISYVCLKIGLSPESTIYTSIFLSIVAFGTRLFILHGLLDFKIMPYLFNVVLLSIVTMFVAILFPLGVILYTPASLSRFILVLFLSLLSSCLSIYVIGMKSKEKLFIKSHIASIFHK